VDKPEKLHHFYQKPKRKKNYAEEINSGYYLEDAHVLMRYLLHIRAIDEHRIEKNHRVGRHGSRSKNIGLGQWQQQRGKRRQQKVKPMKPKMRFASKHHVVKQIKQRQGTG
jgi:hypothetical protein